MGSRNSRVIGSVRRGWCIRLKLDYYVVRSMPGLGFYLWYHHLSPHSSLYPFPNTL